MITLIKYSQKNTPCNSSSKKENIRDFNFSPSKSFQFNNSIKTSPSFNSTGDVFFMSKVKDVSFGLAIPQEQLESRLNKVLETLKGVFTEQGTQLIRAFKDGDGLFSQERVEIAESITQGINSHAKPKAELESTIKQIMDLPNLMKDKDGKFIPSRLAAYLKVKGQYPDVQSYEIRNMFRDTENIYGQVTPETVGITLDRLGKIEQFNSSGFENYK